jgi:hypothetical protein
MRKVSIGGVILAGVSVGFGVAGWVGVGTAVFVSTAALFGLRRKATA